jgi:hypothetical protein
MEKIQAGKIMSLVSQSLWFGCVGCWVLSNIIERISDKTQLSRSTQLQRNIKTRLEQLTLSLREVNICIILWNVGDKRGNF